MKLGLVLSVNAVISAAFGLGFVAAPGPVLAQYAVATSPAIELLARLFGGALLGYGAMQWRARAAPDSEALRAMVFAFFVANALGTVVAAQGTLAGVVNAMGWSAVGIYGVLAAGYARFAFGPAQA